MTNDVNISLLLMLVVMLSKFSGDLFTHSLYHSMLDFKCIPYLESELKIYNENKRYVNVNYIIYSCSIHICIKINYLMTIM